MEDDFVLAQLLQLEELEQLYHRPQTKSFVDLENDIVETERKTSRSEQEGEDAALALALYQEELHAGPSFVDAKAVEDELGPTPDVRELFIMFDKKYFEGKLASVEVKWSDRMTLCAGLCEYHRGGYCVIKLSEKLLKFRSRKEFIETLLHEMIHAYLFVTRNNRDRDGHGPEFQKHMHRLNKAGGYNITIYHSFMDEVDFYRTHWWQCQGKCRRIVKRAMNRAPSKHDWWWSEHGRRCGGEYKKIKEPPRKEKRGSGGGRKRKREERPEKTLDGFVTKKSRLKEDEVMKEEREAEDKVFLRERVLQAAAARGWVVNSEMRQESEKEHALTPSETSNGSLRTEDARNQKRMSGFQWVLTLSSESEDSGEGDEKRKVSKKGEQSLRVSPAVIIELSDDEA